MEPEEIFVSVSFILHFPLQKHKKKYHSIYVIRAIFAIKCKNAEGCVGH